MGVPNTGIPETPEAPKEEVKEDTSADMENEQRKIAEEREKLRQETEIFEQRKALAEEQRKLESQLYRGRLLVSKKNRVFRSGRCSKNSAHPGVEECDWPRFRYQCIVVAYHRPRCRVFR